MPAASAARKWLPSCQDGEQQIRRQSSIGRVASAADDALPRLLGCQRLETRWNTQPKCRMARSETRRNSLEASSLEFFECVIYNAGRIGTIQQKRCSIFCYTTRRALNMTPRLSYDDSCRSLQSQQLIDEGEIPPLSQRPPRHDDDVLGVSFFRTELANAKLERLTLPRTFFRSEIRATSFETPTFPSPPQIGTISLT